VKKLNYAVTPVKTGVQSIAKALKTLDSGFRRNDVKKNRTDYFTPSLVKRGQGEISGYPFARFRKTVAVMSTF